MSTVAREGIPRRQSVRVLRHFASARGAEVAALQGSPLLGMYLANPGLHPSLFGRQALLLLGSIALTAHVFLFNDWADFRRDTGDQRREGLGVGGYGIDRSRIADLAIALLVLAAIAFAAAGVAAMSCGAGIAALSAVYSFSPRLGKSTPIAASLNHLVGGALHFLLGYSLAHAVDARGFALSLVFGLVFAAGHLNQEVRDYNSDRENSVRTVAVAIGPQRGFVLSFCLFTAAYALIVVLAAVGVLPKLLLLSVIPWMVQSRWSLQ